jgi:hypothetical protein
MLLFRDEEHVGRWRTAWGRESGAAFSVQQCWRLAQAWYGDRLDRDWRRKSVEEAQAILTRVGFHSDFWKFT